MEIKDFNYLSFSNNYDKTHYFNNLIVQEPDECLLHYFTDMEGFFRINNLKYPIHSGALFITHPEDHYYINPVKTKSSLGYFIIKLKPKENEEDLWEFINTRLGNKSFQLNPGQKIALEEALGKLNSKFEFQRESSRHRIIAFLYELPACGDQKHNYQDSNHYIEKAVKYMHTKVKEELSLNELCSHICISEPHCIRLFKGRMGTTPMKYFTSIKIEEAISLLLTTNNSLAQIAEDLNFSSPAHFSKTFKLFMSISPTQYRSNYINTLEHRQKVIVKEKEHAYDLIQTVIDAIPDLVFMKDTNGILISGNTAICRVLGLTKEQFAGKSDYELFPKEEADFFKIRDKMVYRNNRAYKNEEEMTYPDGIKRTFEVHKAPFHDDQGNILGLVGISRDITDRIQARVELEEARSRKQSLSQQQAEAMVHLSEQLSFLIDNNGLELNSDEGRSYNLIQVRLLVEGLNSFFQTMFRSTAPENKGIDPEILFIKLENRLTEALSRQEFEIIFNPPPNLPEIVFVDDRRMLRALYFLIRALTFALNRGSVNINCSCLDKTLIIKTRITSENLTGSGLERVNKIIVHDDKNPFKPGIGDPVELTMAGIELKALKAETKVLKSSSNTLEVELAFPFPHGVEYLNRFYSPKN